MPNLSARFSMLREQDDPKSMLGKANDDSVLFPKRASRSDLFNCPGLSDIAEADSARGSSRPPFALRAESYSTDDNGTDDDASRNGSVISRAKPGEGNTMFGGRQKIYKIPVENGTKEKAARSMGGKAMYESDIASSAFQRLREQEKEENDRAWNDRPSTRSSKEDDRSNSPPPAHYNRNRETSSSTNSGPSYPRTSTAATSVASQKSVYGGPPNANGSPGSMTSPPSISHASTGLDRSGTKAKRLYGHGLDQHMYEQQSSAMHRLESLHRQRAAGPSFKKNMQQSRSATNLNDRFQRGGNLYASSNFRAASPPPTNTPSRLAEFDLGLGEESSIGMEKNGSGYGRSPPLSPPRSPTEDQTFLSALEPNDIGKATASGAFNKPKKQYDEQQYLQRQKQLQQGRDTPPPARPFSPNAPSIDEQVVGRTRNNSQASIQSKTGSIRRPQGHEHSNHDFTLNPVPEAQSLGLRRSSDAPKAENSTNFLNASNESEVSSQSGNDTDQDSPLANSQYQSLSKAVVDAPEQSFLTAEHPARRQAERLPTTISEDSVSDTLSQKTITNNTHSHKRSISKSKVGKLEIDSPTLGPANGLSGLVRSHLRNDSGASSIYPEQSPGLLSKFPNDDYHTYRESVMGQSQTFFSGDALSDDEHDNGSYQLPKPDHPEEMPPPLAVTARNFLEQAAALKNQESAKVRQVLGNDKAQRILGRGAPRSSHEAAAPSWHDQLRAHHHARGGSTETEKEREAFSNELAERRRMVQDNLKTFVESESRSGSPGPSARSREDGSAKPGTPFDMLRSKNSGGSLVAKNEQPTKAMKMLGIGPGGPSPGGPGSNLATSSARPSADFLPEESEQRTRYMNDGQRAQMPIRSQPKPASQRSSPPMSKSSNRDRSGSATSEKVVEHGNAWLDERRPSAPREQTPNAQLSGRPGGPPRPGEEHMPVMISQIPPAERSQSAMAGRIRSNSRTNTPGYFEQRAATTSSPAASTNAGGLSRPSPMASSYSAHSLSQQETPPGLPASTSPQMIMSAPSSAHSYHRRPTYRNGSINKHDISEPYFLSSTSSVSTVDLPPGASLSNGMDPPHGPPPVPPLNPRRKRTQTLLQALGRLEKADSPPKTAPSPHDPYEEHSTFSADEGDAKPKPRHKLRKSSSEGGNLNAKARQQAMKAASPAMPQFPQNTAATPSPTVCQLQQDGFSASSPKSYYNDDSAISSPVVRQHRQGFQGAPSPAMRHFPQQDNVPASAVMF